MASSLEYVQYIVEQLSEAGTITYKKMFGEYAIYFEGKYFAGVFDNQFLVKIIEAGKALMPEYETALPYEGAKPMLLITELENRDFLKQLTRATCQELPLPKPKRRKKKKDEI